MSKRWLHFSLEAQLPFSIFRNSPFLVAGTNPDLGSYKKTDSAVNIFSWWSGLVEPNN
jgi:hypothetical protein